KPPELGPGTKRFLAAASFFLVAFGAIAFATPNASSQETAAGSIDADPGAYRVARGGRGEAKDRAGETAALAKTERFDPDRTFTLLCADPETAGAALNEVALACNFGATPGANGWTLVGRQSALRGLLAGGDLQLEDPARFDEAVPEPVDKITTRTGEHYQGTIVEDSRAQIVLATSRGTSALPD